MNPLLLPTASVTSLYPITKGVSKQLQPIYDRPMVAGEIRMTNKK